MQKNKLRLFQIKTLVYEESDTISQASFNTQSIGSKQKKDNEKSEKKPAKGSIIKIKRSLTFPYKNDISIKYIFYSMLKKYRISFKKNMDIFIIQYYFKRCRAQNLNEEKEDRYIKKYFSYIDAVKIIPYRAFYFRHHMFFLERPIFKSIFLNKMKRENALKKLVEYEKAKYPEKFQQLSEIGKESTKENKNKEKENQIVFNTSVLETLENYSTTMTQGSNMNNEQCITPLEIFRRCGCSIKINKNFDEGNNNNQINKNFNIESNQDRKYDIINEERSMSFNLSEIKSNNTYQSKSSNNQEDSIFSIMKELAIGPQKIIRNSNKQNQVQCQQNLHHYQFQQPKKQTKPKNCFEVKENSNSKSKSKNKKKTNLFYLLNPEYNNNSKNDKKYSLMFKSKKQLKNKAINPNISSNLNNNINSRRSKNKNKANKANIPDAYRKVNLSKKKKSEISKRGTSTSTNKKRRKIIFDVNYQNTTSVGENKKDSFVNNLSSNLFNIFHEDKIMVHPSLLISKKNKGVLNLNSESNKVQKKIKQMGNELNIRLRSSLNICKHSTINYDNNESSINTLYNNNNYNNYGIDRMNLFYTPNNKGTYIGYSEYKRKESFGLFYSSLRQDSLSTLNSNKNPFNTKTAAFLKSESNSEEKYSQKIKYYSNSKSPKKTASYNKKNNKNKKEHEQRTRKKIKTKDNFIKHKKQSVLFSDLELGTQYKSKLNKKMFGQNIGTKFYNNKDFLENKNRTKVHSNILVNNNKIQKRGKSLYFNKKNKITVK